MYQYAPTMQHYDRKPFNFWPHVINVSAPGIDNLTNQDTVELLDVIAEKLMGLINNILETSGSNWRLLKLYQLRKTEKTLIAIIISQLHYWDTGKDKYSFQYAFQKHRDTLGTAVDCLKYLINELDKNKYVVVFVDLRRSLYNSVIIIHKRLIFS